jgi:hypothetical protein
MDALMPQLLTAALLNLVVAAVALVLFTDWRIRLAALAVQYAASALLLSQAVIVEVALVRAMVGGLVVAILFITARQYAFGQAPMAAAQETDPAVNVTARRTDVPTGLPFRLMAALMFVIAAVYLAGQPITLLPGLEVVPSVHIASYLLMALGLLNLGLSEEPMRAGTGLLTFMMGFGLFYAEVEPSLAVIALLAASEFGVALAVSYLTVLQFNRGAEAAE